MIRLMTTLKQGGSKVAGMTQAHTSWWLNTMSTCKTAAWLGCKGSIVHEHQLSRSRVQQATNSQPFVQDSNVA